LAASMGYLGMDSFAGKQASSRAGVQGYQRRELELATLELEKALRSLPNWASASSSTSTSCSTSACSSSRRSFLLPLSPIEWCGDSRMEDGSQSVRDSIVSQIECHSPSIASGAEVSCLHAPEPRPETTSRSNEVSHARVCSAQESGDVADLLAAAEAVLNEDNCFGLSNDTKRPWSTARKKAVKSWYDRHFEKGNKLAPCENRDALRNQRPLSCVTHEGALRLGSQLSTPRSARSVPARCDMTTISQAPEGLEARYPAVGSSVPVVGPSVGLLPPPGLRVPLYPAASMCDVSMFSIVAPLG